MGYAQTYFQIVTDMLREVIASEADGIRKAAEKIAETAERGGKIYFFGATHAGILAEEAFYRSGGLVIINPILPEGLTCTVRPITDTSARERVDGLGAEIAEETGLRAGDLLLIHSVSGRNAVPVDMAVCARKKGVYVIAITSLAYSRASAPRAKCGLRLYEAADLVIDNHGVFGDAAVEIRGFAGKAAPTSTVTGAAIVNGICAEVCGIFADGGMEPPVFSSANMDGGDARNRELLTRYRDRITYM